MDARHRLFRFERTDSTNERALAAVAAGDARDGDLFVAEAQTAGRGRRGRRWESAAGNGLFASYVHLPAPPPPPPAAVTMAAGLALLDAARTLGLTDARLDWPNDVVVGDAKLAGILVEARGLDPAAPHFVVGVGVNVRQRRFSEALAAEREVTSLALQGVRTTPDALLDALAPRLDARLAQAGADRRTLAADYLAATALTDAVVRVRAGAETLEGRLRALDLEQGLAVETAAGTRRIDLAHVHAVDPVP